jgi:hypothetical protein
MNKVRKEDIRVTLNIHTQRKKNELTTMGHTDQLVSWFKAAVKIDVDVAVVVGVTIDVGVLVDGGVTIEFDVRVDAAYKSMLM